MSTGPQTNKQRMQAIFAELAQGNGRPFVDAMADDFCWILPGRTAWSRRYEGKQAVRDELLRPLFAQFADTYTNQATRFIAEGDMVVVECRGRVTTKKARPTTTATVMCAASKAASSGNWWSTWTRSWWTRCWTRRPEPQPALVFRFPVSARASHLSYSAILWSTSAMASLSSSARCCTLRRCCSSISRQSARVVLPWRTRRA